jgi:hypothetical protein
MVPRYRELARGVNRDMERIRQTDWDRRRGFERVLRRIESRNRERSDRGVYIPTNFGPLETLIKSLTFKYICPQSRSSTFLEILNKFYLET